MSPIPRPKALIDIFKGKKEDISTKLMSKYTKDDNPNSSSSTIRLTLTKKPKGAKNRNENDWISLLKSELNERTTNNHGKKENNMFIKNNSSSSSSPLFNRKAIVVKSFRSPFDDDNSSSHELHDKRNGNRVTSATDSTNTNATDKDKLMMSLSYYSDDKKNNVWDSEKDHIKQMESKSLVKKKMEASRNNMKLPEVKKLPISPSLVVPTSSYFGLMNKINDNHSDSTPVIKKTIPRCVRCHQPVAVIDKISLSGVLWHRSCLTCSQCGVSLRWSEVRGNQNNTGSNGSNWESKGRSSNSMGGMSSLLLDNHSSSPIDWSQSQQLNYVCILCSKNKSNLDQEEQPRPGKARSTTSSSYSNSSLSITSSASSASTPSNNSSTLVVHHPFNRLTTENSSGSLLLSGRPPVSPKSGHRILPNNNNPSSSTSTMNNNTNSMASAFSSSSTDDYQSKLKERMRWKEQFLYNNNNIDFGSLVKRELLQSSLSFDPSKQSKDDTCQSSQSSTALLLKLSPDKKSPTKSDPKSPTTTTPTPKITERIEFENASQSCELFDDDELTKMLNLEDDSNDTSNPENNHSGEDDEEESTTESGSWKRSSEDSTDADFDSDEFDASEANRARALSSLVISTTARTSSSHVSSKKSGSLSIPDIVVDESPVEDTPSSLLIEDTLEEVTNTSQQIDTGVLESSTSTITPLLASGDMQLTSCKETGLSDQEIVKTTTGADDTHASFNDKSMAVSSSLGSTPLISSLGNSTSLVSNQKSLEDEEKLLLSPSSSKDDSLSISLTLDSPAKKSGTVAPTATFDDFTDEGEELIL